MSGKLSFGEIATMTGWQNAFDTECPVIRRFPFSDHDPVLPLERYWETTSVGNQALLSVPDAARWQLMIEAIQCAIRNLHRSVIKRVGEHGCLNQRGDLLMLERAPMWDGVEFEVHLRGDPIVISRPIIMVN